MQTYVLQFTGSNKNKNCNLRAAWRNVWFCKTGVEDIQMSLEYLVAPESKNMLKQTNKKPHSNGVSNKIK